MSSSDLIVDHRTVGSLVVPEGSDATRADASWLYERYHKQVFHLALRYGRGNVAWAEDMTQEVFLTLLRLPRRLIQKEALSGWFYRVTTNRCLNKLRKEQLFRSGPLRWLLERASTDEPTPERVAVAKDEWGQAFESVNALPPKERVLFFMVHVDGKKQSEAARLLGYSKGYVSRLLKRAENRLEASGWKVKGHVE